MNAAYLQHGHQGAVFSSDAVSLRDELNRRAAAGQCFGLEEAVAQIVPLCLELAEVHAQGYGFYLHPSSVTRGGDGALVLARELASELPVDARDRACLPPETQPGHLNDARGNVYAVGAILYELVTGQSVGRGMRRPTEIVPSLPKAIDSILSMTLIIDPERRPQDLVALAQAIHQLAQRGTVPPLPAPVASYPRMESVPVDVAISLLPSAPEPTAAPIEIPRYPAAPAFAAEAQARVQAPQRAAVAADVGGRQQPAPNFPQAPVNAAPASQPPASGSRVAPVSEPPSSSLNGYGVVAVQAAPDRTAAAQAAQMAELKAQLESDTRPRYYVHKHGMDHGPFTALELARHIDSHTFTDEDQMVDSFERRHGPIGEWPPFALFAEHAKRSRQLAQRQKDIGKVAAAEKKSTRGKTLVGVLALLVILGAAGAWYSSTTGERQDTVAIEADEATNVETDGSLAVKGKKGGKARRRSGAAGGIPVVSGGQSCEAAMDAYNEVKVMGEQGQADITAGQYGRVLNSGSYFSHCGVPSSMAVNICAAVQNGRAVGVTVSTRPSDPKKVSCITSAVRNLSFPSHPKLDVTRTSFAAQ